MKMTCKEDSSVNNNCGQPNLIGWLVEGGAAERVNSESNLAIIILLIAHWQCGSYLLPDYFVMIVINKKMYYSIKSRSNRFTP